MYTDPLLIARLAHEIDGRFRGARVSDAGLLEKRRFAIAFWKQGKTELLCADVFAPTPLLAVCDRALPIATEPGFVRTTVTTLRGKTLRNARAIEGERIVQLRFGSQSRFGVVDEYTIVFELVPRFGNIILLKGETVLAALKEFRAGKGARTIQTGKSYEPPPPRGKPARALGVAASPVEVANAPLYVYRDSSDAIVQAYIAPLPQYAQLTMERSPSLLDVSAEVLDSDGAESIGEFAHDRRKAEEILGSRERRLRAELERIESQLGEAAARGALRAQGETIYATLHDLAPDAQREAKEQAVELFSRYKKAARTAKELAHRRTTVTASLGEIDELRWELERASPDQLQDVLQIIEGLGPRRKSAQTKKTPKRKPQEFTIDGARILVGRSPIENAEITFRVAKPSDLWFHVRGQPGAHVILQRSDRREPSENQIRTAAQLAAFHSRAKTSGKVTVDFTQRKHVRKRPAAAPGLVFYTNARSITVAPKESF